MAKEYRLSPERLKELQDEMSYLKTVREKEVAELIKEARSFGDLSENSEYDEAKNEQGKLYSRMAELDEILNIQPLDEDAARSLICKLAQEQYDAIGNEEYETERLRRLFTAFECTAELNAELLQSAVSAVLVTRQTVRLQLKNGQIIGKDDLV